MRYVLDTNIVSALMRGTAPVVARLEAARVADVLLPQPVLAEVVAGLEQLPRSRRERELRRRFERIVETFPRSPWTDEVSRAFGQVKARVYRRGHPLEDFDIAIAAHALVEGAVLVTSNLRHFERVDGLRLDDWLHDA